MHAIGGVPVLMKALLDGGFLHGDCITVTGKTIAENLADVEFRQIRKWYIPPLVLCRRQAAWLACAETWLRKVQL